MNISAPFIQRPIATALLMVGLLAGGLVAYPLLPVASLPNVNYPTLQVTAQLPGADPLRAAVSGCRSIPRRWPLAASRNRPPI
jgi:multidrug efflux pump subunit AcrB